MLCILCAATKACYSCRASGFGFRWNILYRVTERLHVSARASHPRVVSKRYTFFWPTLG